MIHFFNSEIKWALLSMSNLWSLFLISADEVEPFENCLMRAATLSVSSCGARYQRTRFRRWVDEWLPGIRFGLGNHKSSRNIVKLGGQRCFKLDDTPQTHNILQEKAEMTHDQMYGFPDHWWCWILCPYPIRINPHNQGLAEQLSNMETRAHVACRGKPKISNDHQRSELGDGVPV